MFNGRSLFSRMDVTFKACSPDAFFPSYSTIFSAGLDFFASEKVIIHPYECAAISTGIAIMWTDPNAYLQLGSRSGMCLNDNIVTEAGVIDYDYCKEIKVILRNMGDREYVVERGQKISQGLFIQRPIINMYKTTVDFQDSGEEYFPRLGGVRSGGFGSTGR